MKYKFTKLGIHLLLIFMIQIVNFRKIKKKIKKIIKLDDTNLCILSITIILRTVFFYVFKFIKKP